LPSRMSSMRPAARSVPKALVSTERMYSSEPRVMAMNWSASWRKSSRTLSTSPRVTCLSWAMAVPICWTSLAERYLNTSAAASSPKDMVRMAQRLSASVCAGLLVDIFLLQPGAQHHGDCAWVLRGHGACGGEVLLVAGHLAGATLCGFHGSAVVFQFLRFLLELFLSLGHVVEDRAPQAAPEQDGGSNDQDVLQQLQGVVDVRRVLPERRLTRAFFAEQGVHHADRIATIWHVTHGLLHELVNLLDFFVGKRLGLAINIAVVHHHGHRKPAQLANGIFHVADGAVHFVVDGGVIAGMALRAERYGRSLGATGGGSCTTRRRQSSGSVGQGGTWQWLAIRAQLHAFRHRLVNGRDRVRRGLIGQSAGNTFRSLATILQRGTGLLATYCSLTWQLVGAIDFRRLLALREVDIGADLCANVARSHNWVKQGENALNGAGFDFRNEIAPGRVTIAGASRGGKQAAILVDHRHIIGCQIRHAGGHQPGNGRHLSFTQHAARVERKQHGSGRRLAIAHEQCFAGQGQVHPGGLRSEERRG